MKTKAAPLLLYAKFERAAAAEDAVAALILVGKRLREFLKSKLNTISGLIIFSVQWIIRRSSKSNAETEPRFLSDDFSEDPILSLKSVKYHLSEIDPEPD